MTIAVLGLNHKSSRLELREAIQRNIEGIEKAYASLTNTSAFQESLILSTCNRIEIYFTTPNLESAVRAIESLLLEGQSDHLQEFRNSYYLFQDEDAIRHCFTVAPGLDSMIMGEPEILGQMKRAFQTAQGKGALNGLLLHLFEKAFQTAKEVRTETDIGKGAIGTASVSMSLAQKVCGPLETKSILILGAGKLGEKLIMHLVQHDCKNITLSSRRQERGRELAKQHSIRAVPYSDWKQYLGQTDILISATTHPEVLLFADELARMMSKRTTQPLCLIDLAVPRTVDPEVSKIEQVHAFNIEDLKGIGYQNLKFRENAMAQAYAIIHARTKMFLMGLKLPDFSSLAPMLNQLVQECVREEVAAALGTYQVSDSEKKATEHAAHQLERHLSHKLLLRMKMLASEETQNTGVLFAKVFQDELDQINIPDALKHSDSFLENLRKRFHSKLFSVACH